LPIRFGPFILDLDTRLLTQAGCQVHLSRKAFDLLAALVVERPNVLAKETLRRRLWPDTFVADANLSNLIAEIRDALGDRARTPRYIRTVHGFGYAFCADVTPVPAGSASAALPPVCWIEWGTRRFPLPPGEHIVGRDPGAGVRLDASTVSRRHARLTVTAGGTVLEDLASKNGTFREGVRVTAAVQLADGDAIAIGSVLVRFLTSRAGDSTETQEAPARDL
jgi:DNA-binding winged helix-turn-helix (wHTH) protein